MYYILGEQIHQNSAQISGEPDLPCAIDIWINGDKLSEKVRQPLEYLIENGQEGEMRGYFSTAAPLFSQEFLNVLNNEGIDTIEIFDAIIKEEATGKIYTNYKAVNVLGIIDLELSSKTESLNSLGNWVTNLVIDPTHTHGLRIFRIKQASSQIIIDEKLKNAIEGAHIPGIYFIAENDFSG